MILAGIDIGTNSLRVLIAETDGRTFHELFSDRRVTRLGRDVDRTGRLSPESQERSLNALRDFAGQIRRHAVIETAAIATSALRTASNSLQFIAAVQEHTGINIQVISGDTEARLMLRGVARTLQTGGVGNGEGVIPGPALVTDIGGGSTELISVRQDGTTAMSSLPLGAVYLTERYLHHDPPTAEELQRIRHAIARTFDDYVGQASPGPAGVLVGTAGTITTLASVDKGLAYDTEKINHALLSRERIDGIIAMLCTAANAERRTIPGIEPGREDILLAGALVLQEIMRRFGYDSMRVSDWGLREGIVLDLYDRIHRAEAER